MSVNLWLEKGPSGCYQETEVKPKFKWHIIISFLEWRNVYVDFRIMNSEISYYILQMF